jgi:hypothetical protein
MAIMELSDFPRPPGDNGRGLHWSPSLYAWGQDNWKFWERQILDMNLKWIKVLDDSGGSTYHLCRRLVEIGVMPVVRLYRQEPNPGRIGSRELDLIEKLVKIGVYYFETNNEPDLDLEWEGRRKPANWLDVVVDNFIFEADRILALGAYPAFPAFGPGGLGNPFEKLKDRGRIDLLDEGAWLALHNYCLGRPLDYPNDPVNVEGVSLSEEEWEFTGGLWAWEMDHIAVSNRRRAMKDPDASIYKDFTCFRGFEAMNKLVVDACGHSIPILTTEGGYNVGQRAGTTEGDDPRYPKPTARRQAELTVAMFDYMQRDAPDYYFACMPWLVASNLIGHYSPVWEAQGPWFTHSFDRHFGLSGQLPVVDMVKRMPSMSRHDRPAPQVWRDLEEPELVGRDWDHRLRYLGQGEVQLQATTETDDLYWRLASVKWRDLKESQGTRHIFVKILDEEGEPVAEADFRVQNGGEFVIKTKGAIDDYLGNHPMYGAIGTYTVDAVQDGHPSDRIVGVGLGTLEAPYDLASTSFVLTFQLWEPGQDPFADRKPLEELLLEAAQPLIIPLNKDAMFWKYARKHDLGERLTTEYDFVSGGKKYRAQVYEKAIIYARVGEWDDTTHIARDDEGNTPETSPFIETLVKAGNPLIIPLNRDAMFWKYAREHGLGERLTREYDVIYLNRAFRAQGYEKGIVYSPVGEWDKVRVVERQN